MSTMEKPVGREYEGPSGVFRKSPWLAADDLPDGKDINVKIVKVMRYPELTFDAGRKELNVGTLAFEGKERELILNATKRKTLNKMFGKNARDWKGKEITLYVGQTRMGRETVDCILIRDRGSRPATAAEQFLMDDPGDDPLITKSASEDVNDPDARERMLNGEDDGDGERGEAQ